MSTKKVLIPEIGEVVLAKRRDTRYLRLSVTARGVVRVGMPYWTPYDAGIKFARDRADWIRKHLASHQISDFKDGDRIGKSHIICLTTDKNLTKPVSRITEIQIKISSPYAPDHPKTQSKIVEAAQRALRKESEKLLPLRLEQLAGKHGYKYRDVRVRSLTSRWGSCSSKGVITLSYYLIQLPWELIDYVLLHELTHTEHMNHGPSFWQAMEEVLPGARGMRRRVNSHKPRVVALNFGEIS